jgi:hypothetical protein
MLNIDLSSYNFEIQKNELPRNIYAIKIEDSTNKIIHDLSIEHDGYCPSIYDERDQSQFSEYLCNLENSLVSELNKKNEIKNYNLLLEVMTNSKGELYHLCKPSY